MFGLGGSKDEGQFGTPVIEKPTKKTTVETPTVEIYWTDGTVEKLKNASLSDDGLNGEHQWVVETEEEMIYIPFTSAKKVVSYTFEE